MRVGYSPEDCTMNDLNADAQVRRSKADIDFLLMQKVRRALGLMREYARVQNITRKQTKMVLKSKQS